MFDRAAGDGRDIRENLLFVESIGIWRIERLGICLAAGCQMSTYSDAGDRMSTTGNTEKLAEIAAYALQRAKAHGADAADAIIVESVATSAACRKGALEDIERSEGHDLGLRVFAGKRAASVSSSDFSQDHLDTLAERAVAMARVAPEDDLVALQRLTLHENVLIDFAQREMANDPDSVMSLRRYVE